MNDFVGLKYFHMVWAFHKIPMVILKDYNNENSRKRLEFLYVIVILT